MARTKQTARKSTSNAKDQHFSRDRKSTNRVIVDLSRFSYQPEDAAVRPAQPIRRIATHVLIPRPSPAQNEYVLPTPATSSSQSTEYVTRATASQHSLHVPFGRLSITPQPPSSIPHSWTYHERQALVLFRRAFENDFKDLTKVLNRMFTSPDSPFRATMLYSQYSWLKAGYGPSDGKMAYASIWQWPFHELADHFAFELARVQVAADSEGVQLKPRTGDLLCDMKAAKLLRKQMPVLFRAVSLSEVRSLRGDTPLSLIGDDPPNVKHESTYTTRGDTGSQESGVPMPAPMFEGTPYVTPPSTPQTEIMSFIPAPRQLEISDFEAPVLPKLLWRCVASYTPGLSEKSRIYSGRHKPLAGRPIHVCTDAETLLDEAELHLCRLRMHSPFISTTQSLCWAIMKSFHEIKISSENTALRTQTSADMKLYTIDSMLACEQTSAFKGALLAQELRARQRFKAENILSAENDQAVLQACNYQGHYDFLLYGGISGSPIINCVTLADLEALAAACPHVSRFLRLHLFESTFKIRKIMLEMAREAIPFDRSVAIAVAKLMNFFGVTSAASSDIITAFIYTLMQNWCIEVANDDNYSNEIKVLIYMFDGLDAMEHVKTKLQQCLKDAIALRLRDPPIGKKKMGMKRRRV